MTSKDLFRSSIVVLLFCLMTVTSLSGQMFGIGDRVNSPKKQSQPLVSFTGGCNDGWDTAFTTNGANGRVEVVTSDAAGNFYIAGNFTSVNGVPALGIAKWDGSNWSALGSGMTGWVKTIAVSGGDVYVGGIFTTAGGVPALNIAKWDGSSWSALGPGLGNTGNQGVSTIAISGSDVYAAGNFRISGGSFTDNIAKWDGNSWSALGSGINFDVNDIAFNNGILYAGGFFSMAGDVSAVGVAKWDGTSWSSVGTLETNTRIVGLDFMGNDLYVVGSRIIIAGQIDSHVAKWDGTAWTRLGFFSSSVVRAVAVVGTDVYVGGGLPSPTNTFNHIAKWNGTTWSGVGTGISGASQPVYSMAASGNTLFVAGDFSTAGGVGARNIATYANGSWAGFPGTGIDSAAEAIAVSGSDVYIAGKFGSAGPLTPNRIVKWNGITNTWSALGSGISDSNSSISAIAVAGNKVYAGGNFGTIGGVSASNIAVWNGTTWAPLGTGVSGSVRAITVVGEDVYVGGGFQTAGGVPANRIAKWDGSSWSGLNSAIIASSVTSMAAMGNNLYVGVDYTTLDGPNYFLKFDGSSWTPLGAGMTNGGVTSIAVSGSDIYVTGGFTAVGGIPAARIAKWNGTTWSALGSGLPGNTNIIKLTNFGTDIIATGDFTAAAGSPADRIAKWNGSSWAGLGTGLNANGGTVTSAGGDVYVGGSFTTAGCNLSPYFARWRGSQWTGSGGTDWHQTANWSGGNVPGASAGVTIASNDASISSADVTLSSLIVSNGRTLTVGTGRTLTINSRLDLSSGTLNGTGTLVVNGDLNLTDGGITGLSSITVNGNLYLGGTIAGTGPVMVTACRTSAISGGGVNSYIDAPLRRCINSSGTYRFPVGSSGVYAPIELSGISGSGDFTIEPKSGAYSGMAAGLPANRLQRWWNTTNNGIALANMAFQYADPEVNGYEPRYKVYAINGGAAQFVPSIINTASNRITVQGINSFPAFTLAEGPSTPQLLKGRVKTASGRGAEGVIVTLTDQFGGVRYSITNPFGYYRFPNVMTWENYTVRVNSKRYTFSVNTRTQEFPENAADINFTSIDN